MMQVVHPMKGLTDVLHVDKALGRYWQKNDGDWLDKNGTLNGPTPAYSGSGTSATVDVTGMDDLMIVANSVTQVAVDGVDVSSQCFWTDPTSNSSLALPGRYGRPVIVPNPAGKSLTFTSSGGAWRVDKVALPQANVLPVVKGYTPPNILRIDPTSDAAAHPKGSTPGPDGTVFPGAHIYKVDQGVPFCEAHPRAIYYPTVGYGRVARCDYPIAPVSELYVAYLLCIGPDVWDAMMDLGVKLSGMGANEGRWNIGEHTACYSNQLKNPRNRPLIALRDYFYSAEATAGQGAGNGQSTDKAFGFLRSPGWTLIEHGVKANTFNADGSPNSDGIKRTWINGNLVEDRTIKWFAAAASRWTQMSLQIYHGGTASYAKDCWYGVGPIMCSTQRIGVDPLFELLLAPGVVATPPDPSPVITGTNVDINTVIADITTALNDAYAVAGQASVAQQLSDAQAALATANANLATANSTISTLQGQIATIKTKAGALNTADAAENAALADLIANLPA